MRGTWEEFLLFICGLFNDAISNSDYTSIGSQDDNEYSFGKDTEKWWLPNLRCCPGIWLERLRKTTKALSPDSQSSGRNLNPAPPKYKTGVLTSRL
jgi:hypothetical protein